MSIAPPVVADVVRSGFVESRHRGHVVVLATDGSVARALGDPDAAILPRSAAKPLQAVACLRTGLALSAAQVALACASHSGEPGHLAVVASILADAGLAVDDLANTPAYPIDAEQARAMSCAGRPPTRLTQNCSGKHAAFLAACRHAGWPTDGHLDPEHPLQRLVRAVVEDLTGTPVAAVTVDGCGAPQPAVPLVGLARAFARLATAPSGTAEGRVAAAVRAHPWHVGGTGRDVTALLTAVPGLVAKDGAEAVYAGALPDGRAVAVKIEDGGDRARAVTFVAALRAAGVADPAVRDWHGPAVLGHGQPVGEVRATF